MSAGVNTNGPSRLPMRLTACLAIAAAMMAGCVSRDLHLSARPDGHATEALRRHIDTIVVIYAENRSFDNLFGRFPGAHGLADVLDSQGRPTSAYVPQRDRNGTILGELPETWGGVTAMGYRPAVTQSQSAGLPNAPFAVETGFAPQSGVTLDTRVVTRDLAHRFFENQMQIDSGRNDGFAAWTDAGGLTMAHYDTQHTALMDLAKRFTIADHFFQGAFGGSFLNHQYLICACAPEYPHADTSAAKPRITVLDHDAGGHTTPWLAVDPHSPASAREGPPRFIASTSIAPANYFGDGTFRAVNTMQPPYQPSYSPPAADDPTLSFANPLRPDTLPPQTITTIGDLLDDKGVSWAWYAGAWRVALADGMQPPSAPRRAIYAPMTPAGSPNFQPHHQPFNYYADFDPVKHPDARARHLKDYDDLLVDIGAGHLPAVTFYKPQGNLNQHSGYASTADGDAHMAELVARLEASPQWPHMLIVITYDEFGGYWDHVPPPKGDLLGPGTRIPALIISPFSRRGYVDHSPYDTGSVLRLITHRFDLPLLQGLAMRDAALKAHGEPPMGDLTAALTF